MACISGNSSSSNILSKTEAPNVSDQASLIESKTASIAISTLFKLLPKELLNEILHYLPTRSSEEVAGCIRPLQAFLAPDEAFPQSKVFDSICAKKFANWANRNAIPVDRLGLSHHTNSGQEIPLHTDLTKVLPLLKLQEADLERYEELQLQMCHLHELGLLAGLPAEVLDLIVDKLPINDHSKAIAPMKLLYKVFPGDPQEQVVLGSIDPIMMATWIEKQRCPLARLGLSTQDLLNLLPHLEYLDLRFSLSFPFELLETCKIKTLIIDESLELSHKDLNNILDGSTELTSLTVMNSSLLKDGEIGFLLTHLPKLKTLTLHRLSGLTDQGLKFISGLKQLTSLLITACPKLTGRSIDCIARNLENLESLSLHFWEVLDHDDMLDISKLKKLKVLSFMGSNLTNAELQPLTKLENLKTLHLSSNWPLEDTQIKQLEEALPNVKIFQYS